MPSERDVPAALGRDGSCRHAMPLLHLNGLHSTLHHPNRCWYKTSDKMGIRVLKFELHVTHRRVRTRTAQCADTQKGYLEVAHLQASLLHKTVNIDKESLDTADGKNTLTAFKWIVTNCDELKIIGFQGQQVRVILLKEQWLSRSNRYRQTLENGDYANHNNLELSSHTET